MLEFESRSESNMFIVLGLQSGVIFYAKFTRMLTFNELEW